MTRLVLWIRLELALRRRRRDRRAYSEASRRGAATATHRQFERDPLINSRNLHVG